MIMIPRRNMSDKEDTRKYIKDLSEACITEKQKTSSV